MLRLILKDNGSEKELIVESHNETTGELERGSVVVNLDNMENLSEIVNNLDFIYIKGDK